MEGIWGILVIIGPVLLVGALIWAFVRNRATASPGEIARAERGARELREEIEEGSAPERRPADDQAP